MKISGKIDPKPLSEGGFRKGNPRFQGEASAQNQRLADALGAFATARGVTAAQVALAWLASKAPEVVPIPGARRASRLAENAAAMNLILSADEVGELDGLFSPDAVAGARYAAGGTAGIEVA